MIAAYFAAGKEVPGGGTIGVWIKGCAAGGAKVASAEIVVVLVPRLYDIGAVKSEEGEANGSRDLESRMAAGLLAVGGFPLCAADDPSGVDLDAAGGLSINDVGEHLHP